MGVTTASSPEEKVRLFRAMFQGRDDVYARRYVSAKAGKAGYSPRVRGRMDARHMRQEASLVRSLSEPQARSPRRRGGAHAPSRHRLSGTRLNARLLSSACRRHRAIRGNRPRQGELALGQLFDMRGAARTGDARCAGAVAIWKRRTPLVLLRRASARPVRARRPDVCADIDYGTKPRSGARLVRQDIPESGPSAKGRIRESHSTAFAGGV